MTHPTTAMLEAFGGDRVELVPEPTMASEDFAYYGQHVPACFYLLGLQADGAAKAPPLPSSHFDFVNAAIPTAIARDTATSIGQLRTASPSGRSRRCSQRAAATPTDGLHRRRPGSAARRRAPTRR